MNDALFSTYWTLKRKLTIIRRRKVLILHVAQAYYIINATK